MDILYQEDYPVVIREFLGKDIYVICSSCGEKAVVKVAQRQKNDTAPAVEMRCTACDCEKSLMHKPGIVIYTSEPGMIKGRYAIVGANIDPYFHMPLWLTIPCGDQLLWAYNYDHLNFIQQELQRQLTPEEENDEPETRTVRLPGWMHTTHDTELILNCIARLKAR